MMAYTDFLARRKWLFDLRLSQLKHIYHSTVSLDQIIESRELFSKNKSAKSGDCGRVEVLDENDDESSFLKQRKEKKPVGNQEINDGEEEQEYDGIALNPLVDTMASGFSDLPNSPLMNSPSGCPSTAAISKIISEKGGQKAVEKEGVFTPMACAHRIRYGCLWVWVKELFDFVRTTVTGRDHFFSALIPPARVSDGVCVRFIDRVPLHILLLFKCSLQCNHLVCIEALHHKATINDSKFHFLM